jgi:hypothetical protein
MTARLLRAFFRSPIGKPVARGLQRVLDSKATGRLASVLDLLMDSLP